MLRCFVLLAMMIFLCLPQAFALGPQKTYTIGVASWVGWSFVSVAEANGYFKDTGLSVKVNWYAEPEAIHKAFENGEIDFRLDFVATVVDEFLAGHDVTLLAETNWSHGGDKIIARKGMDFASQKGTTIGLYRKSTALIFFLSTYLSNQKLRLSDYKLREMPLSDMNSAFKAGTVPFVVAFDPYTVDLVKGGDGVVKGHSGMFPGCMPEGMYTRTENLTKFPKQDLVAIMGACAKAADWMRVDANQAPLAEILNNSVFKDQAAFNPAELSAMMKFVKIHNSKVLLTRNRPGGGVFDYINDLKKFLSRNGMLTKEFKAEEIVDSSALLEAIGGK